MKKVQTLSAALAAMTLFLQACDPVPRRTLNTEEKIADLYWIYSQFGENYAPLDYKEKLHGFRYDELKKTYLEAAAQTKTNEEFYTLMFRLVAEFKDAHTSAGLTNSSLAGRAQVAYLGFSGTRQGDVLVVKELFPTVADAAATYPIKVGDQITHMDGVALPEIVRNDLAKTRNLGHDQANLTFHMNRIFTRASTSGGTPSAEVAILTLQRGGQEVKVALPWVKKDLKDFSDEQTAAAKKTETEKTKKAQLDRFTLAGENGEAGMQIGFLDFNGRIASPSQWIEKIRAGSKTRRFSDGFRFVDNVAAWTTNFLRAETTLDELKAERNVPGRAIFIEQAKTYPAYVTKEKILDAEGNATQQSKLVGYIYLNTFSPNGDEAAVVTEFKATLAAMQELGVQDVVIDMLNNGGGSLVLGMQLAQALSADKVVMPEIQFRLSDTWMDDFDRYATGGQGTHDAEEEMARRILNEMKRDQANGARLSQRYNVELLAPYQLAPNPAMAESKMNVVVLVNEMCASMCDIFSGIVQDNGIATVVGSRSMGAGGNVVSHDQAPNSHLTLRQTESLILRKDGSYIENVGVTPNVELPTWDYTAEKYDTVYKKAVELLTKRSVK